MAGAKNFFLEKPDFIISLNLYFTGSNFSNILFCCLLFGVFQLFRKSVQVSVKFHFLPLLYQFHLSLFKQAQKPFFPEVKFFFLSSASLVSYTDKNFFSDKRPINQKKQRNPRGEILKNWNLTATFFRCPNNFLPKKCGLTRKKFRSFRRWWIRQNGFFHLVHVINEVPYRARMDRGYSTRPWRISHY